jgi:DNA invertase Pin-like site-specific DNA recombinase
MISLHESEDRTVRNCLALIERHAPRLMREGGGAIEGTYSTPEYRAAVVRRRVEGVRTAVVAAEFGVDEWTVKRWCREAGVKLRKAA